MNADTLRVLNLEADAGDHELVRRQAEATGRSFTFARAANRAEFEAALKRGGIDLILADHCMPGYEGLAPLESAQTLLPGVPYIIVSDSTGEDRAAECIRRGASDFVHKDRIERLPAAIARATQKTGTPQPRLEGELLQAQKMELVGKLAGGIAHDFNNILTIISGNVSMLLDKETLTPSDSEKLKQVFAASCRANDLFSRLLLFKRKRAGALEVVDLNTETELAADSIRHLLGESIVVEFKPSPDSPRVNADVRMLEQLLMILAMNARDAMAGIGRITVAVARRPCGVRGAQDPSPDRAGDFACLGLRDNGRGVPASVLPRIFEPFFTTKDGGQHTGLGLAVARDIAERHGGWIDVETDEGAGAEFRVYFPLTRADLNAPAQKFREKAPRTAGTLLLVEDETGVREFAAAVLQQDGHRLLQAKSAENALEVWRRHSARIDLLLTDVVLPGDLSGLQLAEKLRAEKPGLTVILATGYGLDAEAAQPADGLHHVLLMKPYTPRSLSRAVHDALARHGGPDDR